LGSRIIAVAETFDSLTHTTPFRAASTDTEAIDEIEKGSGAQYDPQVVEAFRAVQPLIQPLTLTP
jgi:response regulator RpfG family c-di-GMP phosphodiesterase